MKRMDSWTKAWKAATAALLCILFGSCWNVYAAGEKPLRSTVTEVKGEALYSSDDGGHWHHLRRGQALRPGVVIQTGKDSFISILIGRDVSLPLLPTSNGVMYAYETEGLSKPIRPLKLYPNSMLKLQTISEKRRWSWRKFSWQHEPCTIRLDLLKGRLKCHESSTDRIASYDIQFAGGVAHLSPGLFGLAQSRVYALSGSVTISRNGENSVHELAAGQTLDCDTGTIAIISPEVFQVIMDFIEPGYHPVMRITPPAPPPIKHNMGSSLRWF